MSAPCNNAELDAGPHSRERERLCAATRTVRPLADLIRFVVGPQGDAVPDIKQKLPGRGVWVTARRSTLDEAIKRKVFARGFKRDVHLPADLVLRTERLLESSVLDALAIAGKAGLVVSGFAKTEAALQHSDVVAVLHASEAAADGVRKLDAALHKYGRDSIAVLRLLTGAQLDLALGRSNVIHAALLSGSASVTLLARLRRLEGFRATDRDHEAGAA